jgi:hypothetical protein
MRVCNIQNAVHLASLSVQMYQHDGFGTRGDDLLNGVSINIVFCVF